MSAGRKGKTTSVKGVVRMRHMNIGDPRWIWSTQKGAFWLHLNYGITREKQARGYIPVEVNTPVGDDGLLPQDQFSVAKTGENTVILCKPDLTDRLLLMAGLNQEPRGIIVVRRAKGIKILELIQAHNKVHGALSITVLMTKGDILTLQSESGLGTYFHTYEWDGTKLTTKVIDKVEFNLLNRDLQDAKVL